MTPYECIEIAKTLLSRLYRNNPYSLVWIDSTFAGELCDVLQNDDLTDRLIADTAEKIRSRQDENVQNLLRTYHVCEYA